MIINQTDKQNAIDWIEMNYSKIKVDELNEGLKYMKRPLNGRKQEKYNIILEELKDRFI